MTISVPAKLTAGDTWAWTSAFTDYPASAGWTAKVYFENSAGTFSADAIASGNSHAFSISAATTGTKRAGSYKWSIRVALGAAAYTVESGWVEVKANPAALGTQDPRSWARRALEAVEAQLEGRATDAQQSFAIRDRSVSRYTLKELTDLHTWLKPKVTNDEAGSAAGKGRQIRTRFSRRG